MVVVLTSRKWIVLMAMSTMFALANPHAAQDQRQTSPVAGPTPGFDHEVTVDRSRGPVDLGLTDSALVGAIDIHTHVDPDAPGNGGLVRAIDAFDAAVIAKQRGMRGFVFKTHQDPASAAVAYLVRRHAAPGLEVFGRMAFNLSTGGINVAALEHLVQIKGGWGRIVEMPTRDSAWSTREEKPEDLPKGRPWILLMPPTAPKQVAVSREGELLPEVKQFINVMGRLRTVDSNGRLVLATGHASPDEHLLLTREARGAGLQVVLTHPGDIAQLAEAVRLGAYVEITASGIYHNDTQARAAAGLIRKIGAAAVIVSSDCGQMSNLLPSDCMALAAKRLRNQGISDRDLELMYKENPEKLLGLPARGAGGSPRSAQVQ